MDHAQVMMGDGEKGPFVDTSTLWDSPHAVPQMEGVPEMVAVPVARVVGITRIEVVVCEQRPDALPKNHLWYFVGWLTA
ncbi:MAG: hypothetical protein U0269_25045 [Polyangiales bacterium]